MRKISMFILIVFSIASLVVFTGCTAPEDSAEPADETMTEEMAPAEETDKE